MRPFALIFLCIAVAVSNLSCSGNILETFADKNTNEALYEAAIANINSGNYNSAITDIGSMTGTYPSLAKVIELKASAYGGLCGLKFVTFVLAFQGIGATRLFPFLLSNFNASSSASLTACITAQNLMLGLGTRTTNQDMFLAMVALAKAGNILSFYGDVGHTLAVTAGYDPCIVGGARVAGGDISDADARELGTALAAAITSLTAVAGKVNLGSGTLAGISAVCTALPAAYNFCGITDPTLLTANEVKGIRTLIKEDSAVGLGGNCSGDISTCFCP